MAELPSIRMHFTGLIEILDDQSINVLFTKIDDSGGNVDSSNYIYLSRGVFCKTLAGGSSTIAHKISAKFEGFFVPTPVLGRDICSIGGCE